MTGNVLAGTMVNSEDQDEMPHNAALHQGLHCFLSQRKKYNKFMKNITCYLSIYTTDHPDLTVPNLMEYYIGLKMVNQCVCHFVRGDIFIFLRIPNAPIAHRMVNLETIWPFTEGKPLNDFQVRL